MPAEFIHVRCPQCQQPFRTSAGAAKDRIRLLMPILKMLQAHCPHCGASMFIGDTYIESPRPPAKHVP